MKTVRLTVGLICAVVLVLCVSSSKGDTMPQISDFKNIFYPAPIPFGTGGSIMYKTDQWIFFRVNGGLHIRDIGTGELFRVIPMAENDYFCGSDKDSVLM